MLSILSDDPEHAMKLLSQAVQDGYVLDIRKNVFFEELYSHPQFNELAEIQADNRKAVAALFAEKNFPSAYELATSHPNPRYRIPEGSIPK